MLKLTCSLIGVKIDRCMFRYNPFYEAVGAIKMEKYL